MVEEEKTYCVSFNIRPDDLPTKYTLVPNDEYELLKVKEKLWSCRQEMSDQKTEGLEEELAELKDTLHDLKVVITEERSARGGTNYHATKTD